MKIILVMASSLDGKITQGLDPNIYTWTSLEDQRLFSSLIEKHRLIIMGSNTYEAVKNRIKLVPDKLRIVLTKNPRKYKQFAIPDVLEFTNESLPQLVERLKKSGYAKLLLVGGAIINTQFFKNLLVDELHLTIEPVIFGWGKTLVEPVSLSVPLRLIQVKKLNQRGTLFLKYKVIKKNYESKNS